jgi:hypothetical protein
MTGFSSPAQGSRFRVGAILMTSLTRAPIIGGCHEVMGVRARGSESSDSNIMEGGLKSPGGVGADGYPLGRLGSLLTTPLRYTTIPSVCVPFLLDPSFLNCLLWIYLSLWFLVISRAQLKSTSPLPH